MLGAANAAADEAFEFNDDQEDEVESEEEEKEPPNIDFANFDYKKTDLNKCTDAEIKAHKAAMEVEFNKKVLRKGDEGFEYDKRVDFKYNADAAQDDSWDESDDEQEDTGNRQGINADDDAYFDDDF